MSTASVRAQHSEWVSALDGDGPWLTVPALTQGLDAGLIPSTTEQNQTLRRAWTAYSTAAPNRTGEAQQEWIRSLVTDLLGWGDHADFTHPDRWAHTDPVHGITITPGFALLPEPATDADDSVVPVLLAFTHPAGTPLTKRVGDGWATTPIDRAAHALRAADIPLGLITDGRWWALLWAPRSKDGAASTPGYALWSTDLLLDDELLRSAFTTLLSRHRSLAVAQAKTLRGLFEKSAESQEDITENLSIQTRKAVELLVDSFSTANHRAGGAYLDGVDADHVYQGAVTIMMRLIFTLAAEERRLLPGDDDFYTKTYGIASLADRIIDRGNLDGEDLLADTYTAFPQILATTRVLHDGIHHNRLNIPGYGGSVFDPHRFPWLETAAGNATLGPIGVDDRTMLHILRGLTRWDGRRLSYRTLDVEQIGYAYEGLLDHTAILATSPVLGLIGKKEPEVTLDDLEAAAARGNDHLIKWLKDLTGDTPAQINKRLDAGKTSTLKAAGHQHLVSACAGDTDLADRIVPWLPLLRTDSRTTLPIVINTGTIYVTASSARGDTGTHYTPKTLAEDVVKTTLDALVYSPGPLDTNDEMAWRLVHPAKIIDLKVADIAMGSGAFLVAAIRYLADQLLEALDLTDRDSLASPALQEVWDLAHREVVKADWDDTRDDETVLAARALVAARSIYGVDINPMAVEMAKLSIWLVTASRNKPFSFLDHRLKVGDSLVGLHDIRQLESLHVDSVRGEAIYGAGEDKLLDFTSGIRSALTRVSELHRQIEKKRVLDTHDVDEQAAMAGDAMDLVVSLAWVADGIVGAANVASRDRGRTLNVRMGQVQRHVEKMYDSAGAIAASPPRLGELATLASDWLVISEAEGAPTLRPLHWPLLFPEVFGASGGGFDAIVGNPPFLGNRHWRRALGSGFQDLMALLSGEVIGKPDLVALFFRRAVSLLRSQGVMGLLATMSIQEGDSRRLSLEWMSARGSIYSARPGFEWPTRSAMLRVSAVHFVVGRQVTTSRINGIPVPGINPDLTSTGDGDRDVPVHPLVRSVWAFQGVDNSQGMSLVLKDDDPWLHHLRDSQSPYLRPYFSGDDITTHSLARVSRWVVDCGEATSDEVRTTSPETWRFLTEVVLPQRPPNVLKSYEGLASRWWQFWRPRESLFARLRQSPDCLAVPAVSKHLSVMLASTEPCYTNAVRLIEIPPSGADVFMSEIFDVWAWKHSGRRGTSINVTLTSAVGTFPLPDVAMHNHMSDWTRLLHEAYRDDGLGYNDLANAMASPASGEAIVERARELRSRCTRDVLLGYGWPEVWEPFGHHVVDGEARWCLPITARDEILSRLTVLNRQRHEEEVRLKLVKAGGKATTSRADSKMARIGKKKPIEGQFGMFEVEGS